MKHSLTFLFALIAAAPLGVQAQQPPRTPVVDPANMHAHVYPPIAEARQDIANALIMARKTGKHVLIDFGADWCGDCQVLNIYFHQAPNEMLLARNYIEVPVNIGREDANLDIAHKYGVPITGVPALAVLDASGKVLVAQDKQFSDMRYMQASAVTEFLNRWKPKS